MVGYYDPELVHLVRHTSPDGARCRAATDGSGGAEEFECAVVWLDEDRDLALLRVVDAEQNAWHDRLAEEDVTVLAAADSDPIHDVTLIGFPDSALDGHQQPNPEQATGTLLPAGGPEDL